MQAKTGQRTLDYPIGQAPPGNVELPRKRRFWPLTPGRSAGETLPVGQPVQSTAVAFPQPEIIYRRQRRFPLGPVSWILFVLLPTVAASLYLAFVATPQYESQTRFVVRGNLEVNAEAAGSFRFANAAMQAMGNQTNSQEGHIIVDYIRSRPMVEAVARELDLRRIFDVYARDPVFGMSPTASIEDLVAYWNRQVHSSLDSISGIITVDVWTFNQSDSVAVSEAILRQAERITNEISIRNRKNGTIEALGEKSEAEARLQDVRVELQAFRNQWGTIDPTQSAKDDFDAIAQLKDDRTTLNAQIATARARMDDDSPVVLALGEQRKSLDDKIAAMESRLLGPDVQRGNGTTSVLGTAAAIEARRSLAEQRVQMAESLLGETQTELDRQQVYVSVFMPPTPATESAFPLIGLDTAIVFAVLMAGWSIVALYVGGVRARAR